MSQPNLEEILTDVLLQDYGISIGKEDVPQLIFQFGILADLLSE